MDVVRVGCDDDDDDDDDESTWVVIGSDDSRFLWMVVVMCWNPKELREIRESRMSKGHNVRNILNVLFTIVLDATTINGTSSIIINLIGPVCNVILL